MILLKRCSPHQLTGKNTSGLAIYSYQSHQKQDHHCITIQTLIEDHFHYRKCNNDQSQCKNGEDLIKWQEEAALQISRFKFGKLRRSAMERGERTRLKRGCWPHDANVNNHRHVSDMEEGSSEIYINIPSKWNSGSKFDFFCLKRFHGRTLPSASPPWQLENLWLLGFSETNPRAEQLRKHIADHMFQSLIFCGVLVELGHSSWVLEKTESTAKVSTTNGSAKPWKRVELNCWTIRFMSTKCQDLSSLASTTDAKATRMTAPW